MMVNRIPYNTKKTQYCLKKKKEKKVILVYSLRAINWEYT